jgi:hypothetical protein
MPVRLHAQKIKGPRFTHALNTMLNLAAGLELMADSD